ncbi:MAG: hypothetical protein R3E53_16390 [Myxococcota bacterium]
MGIEHARAGDVREGEVPLVIGCGAIGLGVIAGLVAGHRADRGERLRSGRRALALAMEPTSRSIRATTRSSRGADLGGRAPSVVYECVGKAGILGQMVDADRLADAS